MGNSHVTERVRLNTRYFTKTLKERPMTPEPNQAGVTSDHMRVPGLFGVHIHSKVKPAMPVFQEKYLHPYKGHEAKAVQQKSRSHGSGDFFNDQVMHKPPEEIHRASIPVITGKLTEVRIPVSGQPLGVERVGFNKVEKRWNTRELDWWRMVVG